MVDWALEKFTSKQLKNNIRKETRNVRLILVNRVNVVLTEETKCWRDLENVIQQSFTVKREPSETALIRLRMAMIKLLS